MEKLETPTFKHIVGELFRRHRHGICAIRTESGDVRFKTTGLWGAKLGLASLIQHKVCSGQARPPKGSVPATEPLELHDLELAATDHLIELLHGLAEEWILGLAREEKLGGRLVTTVASSGPGLICAGLAAAVAHSLCHEDRERHREKHPLEEPDEPRCWLTVIHEMIMADKTDQAWMLGLARGFEFSWFARGDE